MNIWWCFIRYRDSSTWPKWSLFKLVWERVFPNTSKVSLSTLMFLHTFFSLILTTNSWSVHDVLGDLWLSGKFEVAFSPPRLLATLMGLVESSMTFSSRTFITTFWGTFIYLYTEFFRKTLAWEKRRYFATTPLVPTAIWSFCEETSHDVVKCWLFLRLRRPFFN